MKPEGLLKKDYYPFILADNYPNGRIDIMPDNREKTSARKPDIK